MGGEGMLLAGAGLHSYQPLHPSILAPCALGSIPGLRDKLPRPRRAGSIAQDSRDHHRRPMACHRPLPPAPKVTHIDTRSLITYIDRLSAYPYSRHLVSI